MATKGSFLQEKAHNMRSWLQVELPTDVSISKIPLVTEMEAVHLAETLRGLIWAVIARDFRGLRSSSKLTDVWIAALITISNTPTLHSKFWRYCDLFVEATL